MQNLTDTFRRDVILSGVPPLSRLTKGFGAPCGFVTPRRLRRLNLLRPRGDIQQRGVGHGRHTQLQNVQGVRPIFGLTECAGCLYVGPLSLARVQLRYALQEPLADGPKVPVIGSNGRCLPYSAFDVRTHIRVGEARELLGVVFLRLRGLRGKHRGWGCECGRRGLGDGWSRSLSAQLLGIEVPVNGIAHLVLGHPVREVEDQVFIGQTNFHLFLLGSKKPLRDEGSMWYNSMTR